MSHDQMGAFASTIFHQKYAHDVEDRKETWAETAKSAPSAAAPSPGETVRT